MGDEFEPLSARIIEAAIAVHKALGPGFLESIYHAALRVALSRSDIPYELSWDEIDSITKAQKSKARKWPRWHRSLVRGGFLSSSIETPSSEARSIDVNRYSKNKLPLYVDRRFLGLRRVEIARPRPAPRRQPVAAPAPRDKRRTVQSVPRNGRNRAWSHRNPCWR